MKDFLRFNKISTGIEGLDKLLYDGLVVPEGDGENLLIVIRGGDNTEKTIFSMQVLHALASKFAENGVEKNAHYVCNYLSQVYLADLFLDMFVASNIRKLTVKMLEGMKVDGCTLTDSFFDMKSIYCATRSKCGSLISKDYYQEHADEMLCNEALYYNNRTNALHLRVAHQDKNTSDASNAVFLRKTGLLAHLNQKQLTSAEKLLKEKFAPMRIEKCSDIANCLDFVNPLSPSTEFVCVNIADKKLEEEGRLTSCISDIVDALSKFKVAILVVRDSAVIPEEKLGMLIELTTDKYNDSDYLLNYLSITKSRFQSTALNTQQYKRRDYGIEVYPSLHLYCQQRRYLQRALVYTHSNVISETYQQYLDKPRNAYANYIEYMDSRERFSDGCYAALSPTAGKNANLSKLLNKIFVCQSAPKRNSRQFLDYQTMVANEFLYEDYGQVTAIIGEPNTYKRFLTYGGAFSSAHNEEDTLFLLLNKNEKIVRRRLQCPAMHHKSNTCNCKKCFTYMHFMNITLGCITPEELLFYLLQQIETSYNQKSIKRVIIDDLQIVEYCFPLLYRDSLFLPALVDACRDRGIALYIMCDKNSSLCNSLRTEADNVVCTQRGKKGEFEMFVERNSIYSINPSKIYSGKVSHVDKFFTCYEKGCKENKKSLYEIDYDEVDEFYTYSMSNFWN